MLLPKGHVLAKQKLSLHTVEFMCLKILSATPHLLAWSISARHPYTYGNALVWRFCRKHPNFNLKPSYACLLESYWVASFVLPARPKRNQRWLCWFVALCSVAPPSANWTLPAVSSWLRRPLSIWRPSDALSSHLSTRSNGISGELGWLKSMARFTPPLSSHKKATLEVLTSLWLSLRFSVSAVFATVSPKPFTCAKEHGWSKTKNISDKNQTIQVQESDFSDTNCQTPSIQRHWSSNIFLTIFPACCFKSAISASAELAFSTCAQDSKVHVTTRSKLGGVGCLWLEKKQCKWLPSSSSPRGCLVALSRLCPNVPPADQCSFPIYLQIFYGFWKRHFNGINMSATPSSVELRWITSHRSRQLTFCAGSPSVTWRRRASTSSARLVTCKCKTSNIYKFKASRHLAANNVMRIILKFPSRFSCDASWESHDFTSPSRPFVLALLPPQVFGELAHQPESRPQILTQKRKPSFETTMIDKTIHWNLLKIPCKTKRTS